MHRKGIIAVAVLLAILGGALPMAAMYYISWTRAVQQEQERLTFAAHRVIARAQMTFGQATGLLQSLDRLDFPPCSPAHIARMQTLTINSRAVEQIGYFEDGLLKCSSWGPTETRVVQPIPDYTTPDGLQIKLRMNPLVTRGMPMIAIQFRQHNVLIDPARFVDVIADPDIQLAVGTDHGTVATLNAPKPDELARVMKHDAAFLDDNYISARATDGIWTAVALQPRDGLLASLRREQMLLLPLGAVMAGGIIMLIVWLSRRQLSPVTELETSIRRREFIVHYQPIMDLVTGVCVGAEALVRWRRPSGEMVRPDLFIPLAEDSGLIRPLTDLVVQIVVKDLNRLLASDRSLHIAINICADDIKTGRVLPVIQNALNGSKINPAQIWLEATERGLIDPDSSRETLKRAQDMGFKIAIDDFGTGYSSLSYLQSMPIDILKIDKSFVDTIGTDSAKSSVTPYIIDMARALGLSLVAEGVETHAQRDYLREHKVEFGQGWLFAKAMPADEFIAFCAENRKPPVTRKQIALVA